MLTTLWSISQKSFYVHAEWTKTRILYEGNFTFHFQIGDMPPRVFPTCLYREVMHLQRFSPTRYVTWAWILCLNNWRPFTTWLCKAQHHRCTTVACPFFFFCLVWFFKKKKPTPHWVLWNETGQPRIAYKRLAWYLKVFRTSEYMVQLWFSTMCCK